MIVNVNENQDEYDLAIQQYGTVQGVGKLVVDNSLNFRKAILPGQTLFFNENYIIEPEIVTTFNNRKYLPNNGGEGTPLPNLDLGDFSIDFNEDFFV